MGRGCTQPISSESQPEGPSPRRALLLALLQQRAMLSSYWAAFHKAVAGFRGAGLGCRVGGVCGGRSLHRPVYLIPHGLQGLGDLSAPGFLPQLFVGLLGGLE